MKEFTFLLVLIAASTVNADIYKGYACAKSKNYSCALREFRTESDQGNADAQSSLGMMYYMGNGVKQDYSEAAKWYRLAADQGHDQSQLYLGVLYSNGQGVRQDKNIAKAYFGKACDKGLTTSCEFYQKLNEAGY